MTADVVKAMYTKQMRSILADLEIVCGLWGVVQESEMMMDGLKSEGVSSNFVRFPTGLGSLTDSSKSLSAKMRD